jgi:hypothetical protein
VQDDGDTTSVNLLSAGLDCKEFSHLGSFA